LKVIQFILINCIIYLAYFRTEYPFKSMALNYNKNISKKHE